MVVQEYFSTIVFEMRRMCSKPAEKVGDGTKMEPGGLDQRVEYSMIIL